MGGTFHGGLFLRLPFEWCLVDKVNDTSDSTSSDPIMVKVGVLTQSCHNGLSQGFGSISWHGLHHLATDGVRPVIVHDQKVRVIRHACADANASMLELGDVAHHSLESLNVPLSWCHPEC